MMGRSLSELEPATRALAQAFLDACKAAGLRVSIYMTFRTASEQDALYAQGRTKPGKKVTNAAGGQSWHNFRRAFDAAPLRPDGKIDWKDLAAFKRMGECGEKVGLEWGGSWPRFKDMPHFQHTGGHTLAQMRARFGKEAPAT